VHRLLVLLALMALFGSAPSLASAQVGGPRMHIGAGFNADSGGEVEINDGDFDLDSTLGLRGHLDYMVHRYVSVGGLVRMGWWEPDDINGIDRSFLLDLGPRVIGHYDWRDFRFYGGISPGLTISAIDDEGGDFVDNPAAGFTISLTVVGAEWWFSRKVGLFAEIGWVGHWFEHDGDDPGDADVDIEMSQALLVPIGFVFGV
jgi:hypothetical protein